MSYQGFGEGKRAKQRPHIIVPTAPLFLLEHKSKPLQDMSINETEVRKERTEQPKTESLVAELIAGNEQIKYLVDLLHYGFNEDYTIIYGILREQTLQDSLNTPFPVSTHTAPHFAVRNNTSVSGSSLAANASGNNSHFTSTEDSSDSMEVPDVTDELMNNEVANLDDTHKGGV